MENMGPRPVRHDDAVSGLTPARARVLEFLQSHSGSISAETLAETFDQHVNTARGHLEELVTDGLAIRHRAAASGRGRPAWLYQANPQKPEPDSRVRVHGELAQALAAHLIQTAADPAAEARAAGRAWGQQIVRNQQATVEQSAREHVLTILAELGFAPNATAGPLVRLQQCPLLDAARQFPEVVCQVHRGLIAGIFSELDSNDAGVELLPFAEPSACQLILPGVEERQSL